MNDYISREAAINAMDALCDRVCMYSKPNRAVMCGACPLGHAFDTIEEQVPAADVRPVVLCRNCEHYQADCGWCGYFDIGMDVNDFCSRWKKMEES